MAGSRIDWLALSPESQRVIREVVLAEALGYSRSEVAAALGLSNDEVTKRVGKLRSEIRAQLEEADA